MTNMRNFNFLKFGEDKFFKFPLKGRIWKWIRQFLYNPADPDPHQNYANPKYWCLLIRTLIQRECLLVGILCYSEF